MDDTIVVINEPETASQEATPTPKMPSVATFKEIVRRHCHNWSVSSVDNLCQAQTQDLINELTQHFS